MAQSSQLPLHGLPDLVVDHIVRYLDMKSRLVCSRVCVSWYTTITQDQCYWEQQCQTMPVLMDPQHSCPRYHYHLFVFSTRVLRRLLGVDISSSFTVRTQTRDQWSVTSTRRYNQDTGSLRLDLQGDLSLEQMMPSQLDLVVGGKHHAITPLFADDNVTVINAFLLPTAHQHEVALIVATSHALHVLLMNRQGRLITKYESQTGDNSSFKRARGHDDLTFDLMRQTQDSMLLERWTVQVSQSGLDLSSVWSWPMDNGFYNLDLFWSEVLAAGRQFLLVLGAWGDVLVYQRGFKTPISQVSDFCERSPVLDHRARRQPCSAVVSPNRMHVQNVSWLDGLSPSTATPSIPIIRYRTATGRVRELYWQQDL